MPSLIDIGDLTETVEIRGKQLEVQGVSAADLVVLLQNFPELRKVMTGLADADVVQSLIAKLPDAVAAIIAIGTGTPGDAKAESQAKRLAVGEQVDLLTRIWRLTFPRGIRDFTEALEALATEVAGEYGKAQDTKSPGPLNNVSETDIRPTPPGDTPPGN
jgi:hypothetical protein